MRIIGAELDAIGMNGGPLVCNRLGTSIHDGGGALRHALVRHVGNAEQKHGDRCRRDLLRQGFHGLVLPFGYLSVARTCFSPCAFRLTVSAGTSFRNSSSA